MGKIILHSTNNNWASKHSTNSTTKHIMIFQTNISFKLVVIKQTAMLLAVEVAKSTMLMQEQVVALFAGVALEAVQFQRWSHLKQDQHRHTKSTPKKITVNVYIKGPCKRKEVQIIVRSFMRSIGQSFHTCQHDSQAWPLGQVTQPTHIS